MCLAHNLCPYADDIWFWAIAKKAGVARYCLGNHMLQRVKGLKRTPALHKLNRDEGMNDWQLGAVTSYFKEN